jgi:putative FmdB family regulatory protein
MPIHEYKASTEQHCPLCGPGFEKLRKSSEPALEFCPQCGAPVHRLVSAPSLAASGPSLDARNLEKHGFTQYRKSSKGVYEKTAGEGPAVISDKDR